jgi:hypothetical protein
MAAFVDDLPRGRTFEQVGDSFDLISVSCDHQVCMFRQDGTGPNGIAAQLSLLGKPASDRASLQSIEANRRVFECSSSHLALAYPACRSAASWHIAVQTGFAS